MTNQLDPRTNRPKDKQKRRFVCYRCDRVFTSTRSVNDATCPFCKAVPCVSCGKLPKEINSF